MNVYSFTKRQPQSRMTHVAHKYQRCIGLLALVLQFWYEYGGDEQRVC